MSAFLRGCASKQKSILTNFVIILSFRTQTSGPGVSLASVPGPLSITAESVIVEVLVGWSPALPRRFPPKSDLVSVRISSTYKKKKKKKNPNIVSIELLNYKYIKKV